MPPENPPSSIADQVQWLVDRAAIGDLLVDFARALDDHDWQGYADNYAVDGVLDIAPEIRHEGREGMAEFVSTSLGWASATHHLSTNHAITIDGDRATSRSYMVAVHVFDDADLFRHADSAGWYRCTLRRTDEGWRFAHVTLDLKYLSGEPMRFS